jgi:hypothetical protein
MPGIFITKGMTITIPAGTNFLAGAIAVKAHYDVCPTWLRLSIEHLHAARTCRDERVLAWQKDNLEKKVATLEREFEASMQAIVAAAIAIDAFYAVVKDKMGPKRAPKRIKSAAKKKRPSRSSQVSETIKLAFGLKQNGFKILRENVAKIYDLRDRAVHPKGDAGDTIEHPELQVGVEWRLALYRYDNAFGIVRFTIGILDDLARNGRPKSDSLKSYMQNFGRETETLWAKEIFPKEVSAPESAEKASKND